MSTITTRSGKGSPLTNNEVDNNFTNLNTDKAELSGATFTGEIVADAGIALGDNDKATFGAGDDLQIYHDGNNKIEAVSGYLKLASALSSTYVDGNNVHIRSGDGGETLARFNDDSDVKLYHDNAQKFATTSTGIDVIGTATMYGLISSNVSGTTLIQAVGVDSNGFADVEIKSTGTSGASRLYFSDTAGQSGSIKYSHSSEAMLFSTAGASRLNIAGNGNIGFYEDTGTTAKFFWDSSAESLGIGVTPNASANLHIGKSGGSPELWLERTDGYLPTKLISNTLGNGQGFKINVAGTDALAIDSSGNLLVGTTNINPAENNVNGISLYHDGRYFGGTTSNEAMRLNRKSTDGDILIFHKDGTTVGSIGVNGGDLYIENGITGISFNNAYNALIPTTTGGVVDDANQDLGISSHRFRNLQLSGNAYVGGVYPTGIYNQQSGDIQFWVPNVGEAVRIKQNTGDLLVGTSSVNGVNGTTISNSGNITLNTSTTSGGEYITFRINGTQVGSITSSGGNATDYNTSSDQRLKDNIADADDAGSKVDAIQVRKFDWKADGSHQDYGMIAQELQTVAPEAVSGDADSEEMMGVDYSKLVPMLIKEIQSLRNRVAQLEE